MLFLKIVFFQIQGVTTISDYFNPYIMFAISGFAEMIGYSIGLIGTSISRRRLLILYLLTSVIPLVLVALIPATESSQMTLNNALIMLFAFIGKIQVSACFYLGN